MDSMNAIRLSQGGPIGFITPVRPLFSPFGGQVSGLDQVSLGNEVSDADFFAQLAQMKQSAMAARNGNFAAQSFGSQPAYSNPYQPTPAFAGSDVELFNQMRKMKQDALAQAAQSGRGKESKGQDDGQGGKTAGGSFSITAKAIERDGKKIAVSSISIHESGNWGGDGKTKGRDVEHYYDSWDSSQSEKTNTFDHPTKPGAYYQVTVTWADGTKRTVDRQMPASGGYSETIYQGW